MDTRTILDKLRRDIAALGAVSSAGITTRQMHLAYIDEVTDAKAPCLTFTVRGRPVVRQAGAYMLRVFIGVYGKEQQTTSAIVTALTNYFADGFYSATENGVVIHSAALADTLFDYTPEYLDKLKAYESMVELTVLCG
jgi:hypothetical protein